MNLILGNGSHSRFYLFYLFGRILLLLFFALDLSCPSSLYLLLLNCFTIANRILLIFFRLFFNLLINFVIHLTALFLLMTGWSIIRGLFGFLLIDFIYGLHLCSIFWAGRSISTDIRGLQMNLVCQYLLVSVSDGKDYPCSHIFYNLL